MDFGRPYPNSKSILVLIDEYSRYLIARIINSLKTETITQQLKQILMEFWSPSSIKTDNGPPMNGKDFTQFLTHLGIKHTKITPKWPQENGIVERFMKTIGKGIKATSISNNNWETAMDEFLLTYRTTPHSTTKVIPVSLLFKGNFRAWLPEMTRNASHFKRITNPRQKKIIPERYKYFILN